MRILYVIHQFYPEGSAGTERFLFNLARGMQRSGHRVEVITYSNEDAALFKRNDSLLVRDYVYKGVYVLALRHQKLSLDTNSAVNDEAMLSFARSFLARNHFDLVHIVHPMRMSSWATAAAEKNVPYIVTLTDFWTICPKITLQTSYGILCWGPEHGSACDKLCPELDSVRLRDRLSRVHSLLINARYVIAPSMFAADLVRAEFGDISMRSICHGLPLRQSCVAAKREGGNHIIFGYCGGLSPHKGAHVLIKAFRRLDARDARLSIYGDSQSDQSYSERLHDLAAGDPRITFQGRYEPEEIGRVMASIDMLVVPSLWYETYCFVVHEAFASKVPVIASDVGVLAETVKEGQNGLLFRINDEESLLLRMSSVLEDRESLSAMRDSLNSYVQRLEEEELYEYLRLYGQVES